MPLIRALITINVLLVLMSAGPAVAVIAEKPSPASLDERLQRLELSQEAEVTAIDRQDLDEQRTMARAARQMVTLTWAQLLIGVLSVLGLAGTLWLTKRSIDQSRDVAKAQLRPYLAIDRFEAADQAAQPFETNYKWALQNYGSTPATNVRTSALFEMVVGQPDAHQFSGAQPPFDTAADIAPGSRAGIYMLSEGLDPNGRQAIISGSASMAIGIIVQYDDPFGETHTLVFSEIRTGARFERAWHNMRFGAAGDGPGSPIGGNDVSPA